MSGKTGNEVMSFDCKAGLAFKIRHKIPIRQKVGIFQKILENPDLAAQGVTFFLIKTQHLPAKGQHNLKAPRDHTLAHTSSFCLLSLQIFTHLMLRFLWV